LALGFILDGTGLMEGHDGALPDNTYANLELRQFQQRIAYVLKNLTAREQEVIRMHYFHSHSFEEIAQELGLSKGRISQLHKQALVRLRSLLGENVSFDLQL
jgi:RNA polymerase sigma factor for flagellar operon FliA